MPSVFETANRKTVRAPVNPLDVATVVSIFPKEIYEEKPTTMPSRWHIPAGTLDKPSFTVVGPASWWRELDHGQPLLELVNSSVSVAESLVKDYCNSYLCYEAGIRSPGLFYLNGSVDLKELKNKYPNELMKAHNMQRAWYAELVKQADALWARSNGNPLAIADDMRLAARELNLLQKDWLRDQQMMELVRCVACGSLRNPTFPICQHCHVIVDKEMAVKLGLTFANKN